MASNLSITSLRHPSIIRDRSYWETWRECYDGGPDYTNRYLTKFTSRESNEDFTARKKIAPIPSYSKAAVNDIRNAIFQRLTDVVRQNGSRDFMRAVAGEQGGVDLKGTSMNGFIGIDVLTELLVMGSCGVYVDMPEISGPTLADVGNARPYMYKYCVEDILAWSLTKPEEPGEYQSILLRDRGINYQQHGQFDLEIPCGEYIRYRLMWIDKITGKVRIQFYNENGEATDAAGNPAAEDGRELDLTRIPFVRFDIESSLLKDVTQHQAALLNLCSSDVAYALKANFPFYTEQQDMRAVGDHLKHGVNPDGTASAGGQRSMSKEVETGTTQGRVYDIKSERPGFIHPSSEPLKASMELQRKLEDDIRKLVNLAVANQVGRRASSAEAMKMSDQGLEAGLSYIGLVLEGGERILANHWAAYEERTVAKRKIALIKYPDRYTLKNDSDRVKEAKELSDLMFTVPGPSVKKQLSKNIVNTLLSGRITTEQMDRIHFEIEQADYATSDPDTIIRAQEAGLVGEQVASVALGFAPDEYKQARADHAERVARIAEAQSKASDAASDGTAGDANGARGVGDLSVDPKEGIAERAAATDTTLSDSTKKPVRGEGRSNNNGE